MKDLDKYIFKTLGTKAQLNALSKKSIGSLPMFIGETYNMYEASIMGLEFLIAELKHEKEFSVLQLVKHFGRIKKAFGKEVILTLNELPSYNRKRLIEKGIQFIIPNKQMYLPGLFIDLNERQPREFKGSKFNTLSPSAQFILLFHILNNKKDSSLENLSFKNMAKHLGYTPMAITMAIDLLKEFDVVDVHGEKEKFIRFKGDKQGLWRDLEQRKLLISPVIKRVFVDEKPKNTSLLYSNASALPEYSDMNPSRQQYCAIEKNKFYELRKNNALINANEHDGKYCLEVWKYDPSPLAALAVHDRRVVDPLSLYLSLRGIHDERIEMALEQIIENIKW